MKTRDMLLISMFAALTAIGAFIQIPTPIVPFTLQYLFCAFSGLLLGSKKGLYSQLLYVGIGLIGIPVFTKGGGIGYVFQPTFGYLLGFIGCAWTIGKLTESLQEVSFRSILPRVLAGLAIVYSIGVSYLYFILAIYLGKPITFSQAIMIGFVPYVVQDTIFSILVAVSALHILPRLRKMGLIERQS